ncbi:hypothetical protein B0T24DRAFT_708638 [Lasiosphaeria ovina]|uniref:BTB domain-containing protein n=1 Tax=Lasiosphaeria ovina TaxID=92902 RepID=A0AAE0K4D6_9PEZI|nr:hypothetical protein B0T24DRAFT_708638 [Lasiosphaeria ovina]
MDAHSETTSIASHDLDTFELAFGTEKPSAVEDDIKVLDTDGDVVIIVRDRETRRSKQFVASSKVMELASADFKDLIQDRVARRAVTRIEDGGRPSISLGDDNIEAMELLLNILHFRSVDIPTTLPPLKTLAMLGIECDKYDCESALAPWILIWCRNIRVSDITEQTDLKYVVLAAHKFKLPNLLTILSNVGSHMTSATLQKWEGDPLLDNYLPMSVLDTISRKRQETMDSLRELIEGGETALRLTATAFNMTGVLCPRCARRYPDGAKNCRPCNSSTTLINRLCTAEHRVAEYFVVLKARKLWPTVPPFAACSPAEIVKRLGQPGPAETEHKCSAEWRDGICQLKEQLSVLAESAEKILQ